MSTKTYSKRAPKKKEMPEMFAVGSHNPSRPSTDWVTWDKEDTILHLTPQKTVILRDGDQILVHPTPDGGVEVHSYRPRIEH